MTEARARSRRMPDCMNDVVNSLLAASSASALIWGLAVVVLYAAFRLYGILAGAALGIVLAVEAVRCVCECRLIYAASVAVLVNMPFLAVLFALVLGSAIWLIVMAIGLAGIAAFLAASYFHCRQAEETDK